MLWTITSCNQRTTRDKSEAANAPGKISNGVDTQKTVLLSFNGDTGQGFDSSFVPANLTQPEISRIDSILILCVTSYNDSLDSNHRQLRIDLNKYNYKKQLVAALNDKGEKEVWINCFCYTGSDDRWKTEIIYVKDGGNCFFNFKINLTTNQFYDLVVNGEA